jgi:hypothetical protein
MKQRVQTKTNFTQRCLDFQRQYNLKPERCQRITVSGRTIASASYILGNSRQTPPNISLSIDATYRENVIRGEMMKMIRESAHWKASNGFILRGEHINAALVSFIGQYDLYLAFWRESERDRSLVIRASVQEGKDIRGNAVFANDRTTAIALHAACRADDNCAPEPVADCGLQAARRCGKSGGECCY